MAIAVGVMAFVIYSRDSGRTAAPVASLSNAMQAEISDPLDTLSSADIAVNVAQLVNLDEAVAVTNYADSVNSNMEIIQADSQVVAKPQIVTTDISSIKDLQTYVSVAGDTVASVAEKFGLSSDSVRWSNNLAGNTIAAGTELKIPPVNGLVYTVKENDTAETLASRFNVSKEKIISFNDAEINGLTAGQTIVIPGGVVAAPSRGPVFNYRAVFGYNGYDYGYCTWYTANRRAAVGKPVPANFGNAISWKYRAAAIGMPVSNVPQAHAVIWTPYSSGWGHVGFVEEVFADGSVRVSEMNVRGWSVVSEKVLTPEQAAGYSYIY